MKTRMKHNPKYKDRLFKLLFGSMEMRDNIISLYNAINGTNYPLDVDLEITTLEDVIYIKMKDDVSLLIDCRLSLWEQQSSFNPNMPLRGLMYFGTLFSAYVEKIHANIYGSKLIKIPNPRFIVFYNGTRNIEPIVKLKLSDAFYFKDDSGEFEWTATVYNINKGKNDELLKKCKPLSDYMTLVGYIRDNLDNKMVIEKAIDTAVTRCISENILSDFLRKHRAEVMDVCLTEYNEKVFVDGIHAEGVAEGIEKGFLQGIEQGREQGLLQGEKSAIFRCVQDGDFDAERGAKKLGLDIEEFCRQMEEAGFSLP